MGKHVRCPHCKQVVLAPATAGGAPGGAPAAPPQPAPQAPLPQAPAPAPAATAPQPMPAPAPYAPAPQPVAAPPRPEQQPIPPMPEPVFNLLPKETADSILSEPDESDDEVFGSQGFNRLPIPRLPDPKPPAPAYPPPQPAANPFPAPAPQASNPFAFEASAPPAPQPVPVPVPARPAPTSTASTGGLQATTLDMNPFAGFDAPAAPAPAPAPIAQPRPAAVVQPAPAPAPAPAPNPGAPANPWAALDQLAGPQPAGSVAAQPVPVPGYPTPGQPVAYPAPAPVAAYPAPAAVQPVAYPAPVAVPTPHAAGPGSQAVPQREEPTESPSAKSSPRTPRGRAAATASSGGIPKGVLYGVAGYALLMTILAIYGLFIKSGDLPPEHPLSTIPDTFGEFDPATRKTEKARSSSSRLKLDGPLPENLKTDLGGKIEVGQLAIAPIKVERRKLEMFKETKSGKQPMNSPGDALVLRLKVTNNTPDLAFCPLDPAFNRRTITAERPATQVVIGSETFAGGPIDWPFRLGGRQFDREQESDATPLKPGESREYSVCSSVVDAKFMKALRSKEPITWRVQVRRGPIEFHGKTVPVTAIIGVTFRGDQIDGL